MTSPKTNSSKVVWILVCIAIVILAIYERSRVTNRIKNAAFVIGEVIKIDEGAKGSKYVKYRYVVEGREFISSVSVRFCKECNYECCQSGSKVRVRYEKDNPSNSDLVR